MPRTYVRKATEDVDERLILSLLPGRLMTKRMIDKELAILRGLIQAGRREYLALLPGLELESTQINDGLRMTSEMMNGYAAPLKPKLLNGVPATADGRSIDAVSLVGPRHVNGRVTITWRILRHIIDHGGISTKEFVATWIGTYPKLKNGNVSQYVAFLRRRHGVKFKTAGRGVYELKSVLTGEMGREEDTQAAQVVTEAPVAATVMPPPHGEKFTGSQTDILLAEFGAHNGQVNIGHLNEKYQMHSNAFHSVMSALRHRGYNFKNNGDRNYEMTRFPKSKGEK